MVAEIPRDVIAAAQAAHRKWRDVPASVTIAQWAVESGWGKHVPPDSFNVFGIKARSEDPYVSSWTWEWDGARYYRVGQRFRKFASIDEAFEAHAYLLASASAYARARAAPDAEAFARELTGTYATDPVYGAKLISIMRAHDLTRYDVAKVAEQPATPDLPEADVD